MSWSYRHAPPFLADAGEREGIVNVAAARKGKQYGTNLGVGEIVFVSFRAFGVLFVALCLLRRVASKGLPGLLLRGLPDAYFGPVGPMAKEKAGRPMVD
jgi:hypothetical protein